MKNKLDMVISLNLNVVQETEIEIEKIGIPDPLFSLQDTKCQEALNRKGGKEGKKLARSAGKKFFFSLKMSAENQIW